MRVSAGFSGPATRPRHEADIRRPPAPAASSEMACLTMPLPGTAAGIESDELSTRSSGPGGVSVTCVDYSPSQVEVHVITNIEDFLAQHRPPWCHVRWIDIVGLSQMDVIRAVAVKYQLHPLAVEDVLHEVERPKAEDFPGSADQPGRLFIVARAMDQHEGRLDSEQVSMFLGRTTLLTFQDVHRSDIESIRQRIRTTGSRLRENDTSFLLYVLLDGIVDRYFPLLESYSERLGELEEEVLDRPSQDTLQQIHTIKRELMLLRRMAWPMRELVANLQRDKHECLSETSQTYLRDVYDHCGQIIDLIETYREVANAIAETYISVVSNRTNDIVKVLTIIGTIFIPLTFLAGVYGMNMPIPENALAMSYPLFWAACIGLAGGMLLWFRHRGWL
jgi:magnesium transporter